MRGAKPISISHSPRINKIDKQGKAEKSIEDLILLCRARSAERCIRRWLGLINSSRKRRRVSTASTSSARSSTTTYANLKAKAKPLVNLSVVNDHGYLCSLVRASFASQQWWHPTAMLTQRRIRQRTSSTSSWIPCRR